MQLHLATVFYGPDHHLVDVERDYGRVVFPYTAVVAF
jgi:hypothetical protein